MPVEREYVLKRLHIYLKEMYPVIPRLVLGYILFFEIYFLVLLTNHTEIGPLHLGLPEVCGGFTIFAFLLTLRIADDFKDYETDKQLFPERALPSGRVQRKDLAILLAVVDTITVVFNVLVMNNLWFFFFMAAYGTAMSLWFFAKAKIQSSLPLALITHNPVQIVMNIYVISYACFAYDIPLITFSNVMIALTLYFPGLIWEISRKLRAPEDETDYVTYSKLFGIKKPTYFVLGVMAADFFTTSYLVYQLYHWSVVLVAASYAWLVWSAFRFIKNPRGTPLGKSVERYEYVAEGTVVLLIGAALLGLGM